MLRFAGLPMFVCDKAPNTSTIWIQPAHQTVCMWCGGPISEHDANGQTPLRKVESRR